MKFSSKTSNSLMISTMLNQYKECRARPERRDHTVSTELTVCMVKLVCRGSGVHVVSQVHREKWVLR